MLQLFTPLSISHRSERHALHMTQCVGHAQQTIERLEFELKLAKAEAADLRSEWQSALDTIKHLGLQDCETDQVVLSVIQDGRQADLLAQCAASSGLADAALIEAMCEVFLAMTKGRVS